MTQDVPFTVDLFGNFSSFGQDDLSAGLGLGMPPAHIPTGRFGQRAGLWQGPLGLLGWRSLACPGHWLCVALAGHVPPMQMTVLRQSPQMLLRRLADVPPR